MNPYAPAKETAQSMLVGDIEIPAGMDAGTVGQVQILGVLMIVHGIIDVVAAIGMTAYAWMMPSLMREFAAGGGGPPMPPQAELMMSLMFSGLGVAFLVAGVASLLGGVWAIQFRHRFRVLLGLWAGLLMTFSCYCFPTSLILLIYGMFVMMNRSAVYAFDLHRQGHSVKSILEAFLAIPR